MNNQKELNFEPHLKENNIESQEHLEEHYDGFSKKCQIVYNILIAGKKLSVRDAILNYDISSLPRRVKDLNDCAYFIQNELRIKSEWMEVDGKRCYKVYYL